MFVQIPEKRMHEVRFVLSGGWLILIGSFLLGDGAFPGSAQFCLQHSALCLWLYQIGPSLFWGMIVPLCIVSLLLLGHEPWRRICPLAFMSQITLAFGVKPRSRIKEKSWLARYHLYLQFGLFFIGLNCRILLIDGNRMALGTFLIFTILAAIAVVYCFGGRSWCHYFCPMAPVQTVFTGPRGLLGSQAHKTRPRGVTQSMCRTWDLDTGKERSACVGCKSPCFDIDAERTYWEEITKPGARLIRYGYLGLVIGFFGYLYLYTGHWNAYYPAAWASNANPLVHLLDPGITIASIQIPIPKFIACPLVLTLSVWLTCQLCTRVEKAYSAYLRRNDESLGRSQIRHRMFSIITFISFNLFLLLSGFQFISRLSEPNAIAVVVFIMLSSALWLYRTWNRNADRYFKESVADSLRRHLKKLPIDLAQCLPGLSLNQLESDEVYVLAQILPGLAKQYQFQVYRGVLEETLEAGRVEAFHCLEVFSSMRQKMGLSEEDHHTVLQDLCREKPDLFYPRQKLFPDYADRPPTQTPQKANLADKQAPKTESRQEASLANEQPKIETSLKVNQTVDARIQDDRSQRVHTATTQTLANNNQSDSVNSDDQPTKSTLNSQLSLDDERTKLK